MAKKVFQDSKRTIEKYKKASRRDRNSDYRIANTANEALMRNLSRTAKGSRQFLTKMNERDLGRIERLVQNMRAAGRKDVGSFERTIRRTGSMDGMLSAFSGRGQRTVSTAAKVGQRQVGAAAQYATDIDRAGAAGLDMMEETNEGLKQAARYETAQALSERAQVDAATAAQMEFDLRQQKLQHKLAMKEAELNFKNQKKLALLNDREGQKMIGGDWGDIKNATDMMSGAAAYILKHRGEDEATVIGALQSRYGITEPQDLQALTYLYDSLNNDDKPGEPDSVAQEIMAVIDGIPGWNKLSEKQKNIIRKRVRSTYLATTYEYQVNDFMDAQAAEKEKEANDPGFWGGIANGISNVYGSYERD